MKYGLLSFPIDALPEPFRQPAIGLARHGEGHVGQLSMDEFAARLRSIGNAQEVITLGIDKRTSELAGFVVHKPDRDDPGQGLILFCTTATPCTKEILVKLCSRYDTLLSPSGELALPESLREGLTTLEREDGILEMRREEKA